MERLNDFNPDEQLYLLLREAERRQKGRQFFSLFPESGPFRRALYPKHLEFFGAGASHRERAFVAANRVGKTYSGGGFEFVCHLTGLYPDWWAGRRFDHPVHAWAAGDTGKTVRDIQQEKLLGPLAAIGTGLIPAHLITKTTGKTGVGDAVETIYARHASGLTSRCDLKSYDQRRESFQGTSQHVIWLDEEAPADIYAECLTRTMDVDGIVYCTFTPLQGLTDLILQFMPGGTIPERQEGSKYVVRASWDDVPHLTEKQKSELLGSYPPHMRDARARGIPMLGSGAIYPVPESEFVVEPFQIPEHYARTFGFDVGWNRTAAIWAAIDRDTGTIYLTDEHYRAHAEPSIHADAVKARGDWIPGVIDPAAHGRSQKDGEQLWQQYLDLGLDIIKADNTREAGIYAVWQRLSSGRIKVFRTCQNWLGEYRVYRRDERGNIVKENDHLMDATRYLVMSGLDRARQRPPNKSNLLRNYRTEFS